MAKISRKFTGFLWAMLIAIVSFFVIYIFFPDVSNKFFGVSMKEPERIGEVVQKTVEKGTDAVIDFVTEKKDGNN